MILTGDPDQIDREEINALSNGLVQVVERFKGQQGFVAADRDERRHAALALGLCQQSGNVLAPVLGRAHAGSERMPARRFTIWRTRSLCMSR